MKRYYFIFFIVCLRDICPQLKWKYENRRSTAALLRHVSARRAAARQEEEEQEQNVSSDPQAECPPHPRSSYGACGKLIILNAIFKY